MIDHFSRIEFDKNFCEKLMESDSVKRNKNRDD